MMLSIRIDLGRPVVNLLHQWSNGLLILPNNSITGGVVGRPLLFLVVGGGSVIRLGSGRQWVSFFYPWSRSVGNTL